SPEEQILRPHHLANRRRRIVVALVFDARDVERRLDAVLLVDDVRDGVGGNEQLVSTELDRVAFERIGELPALSAFVGNGSPGEVLRLRVASHRGVANRLELLDLPTVRAI